MSNRIRDAFDQVHAEEALKESTMAFLRERTKTADRGGYGKRLALACACLALVLLGLGGWRVYERPVSLISVDVNPSIELGVNRFDRIVSLEGWNDDGSRLAATVDIKNMSYAQGLDALISSDALEPYLANGGLISITVIGSSDEKSEEMRGRISACAYGAPAEVECQCGDREQLDAAHEAGLSFGKYRAFLELQALDPEADLEDVRDATMRQIRDRIEELSCDSDSDHDSAGHGGGHGGGQHGRD